MIAKLRPAAAVRPVARLEILAYAPTEFFHCQHCEVAFAEMGLGARLRAAERRAGLLPPDLVREYAAIADWVASCRDRYSPRLSVRVVDAASIEGVLKALRHRVRRFPAFIFDGRERIVGFDHERLEAALTRRLGDGAEGGPPDGGGG
jgi:hypothetical protein